MATKDSSQRSRGAERNGAWGGSKPAPGLYVVATPIGNLRDVTLRALDLLAGADLVLCEDTRVSSRLMRAYGIATPLAVYNDHNAARVRPDILRRLQTGAAVALISDAGTPLVSDPGYRLVREAAAAGIAVTALPGASAPLAALVAAGLPTDRFLFAGFLPPRSGQRRSALAELAAVPATLVFFESPRRLAASLADMAAALGGARDAAVARELTKLHEELRRATLAELAAHYAAAGAPKGEVVVVVGGPGAAAAADPQDLDAALARALAAHSLRDAVAAVSAATGQPRRAVYARALALGGGQR